MQSVTEIVTYTDARRWGQWEQNDRLGKVIDGQAVIATGRWGGPVFV